MARHGDTQIKGSKGMLEDKPLQGRNHYMNKMSESFIMCSWNIRFTGGLMPCCLRGCLALLVHDNARLLCQPILIHREPLIASNGSQGLIVSEYIPRSHYHQAEHQLIERDCLFSHGADSISALSLHRAAIQYLVDELPKPPHPISNHLIDPSGQSHLRVISPVDANGTAQPAGTNARRLREEEKKKRREFIIQGSFASSRTVSCMLFRIDYRFEREFCMIMLMRLFATTVDQRAQNPRQLTRRRVTKGGLSEERRERGGQVSELILSVRSVQRNVYHFRLFMLSLLGRKKEDEASTPATKWIISISRASQKDIIFE